MEVTDNFNSLFLEQNTLRSAEIHNKYDGINKKNIKVL